MEPRDYPKINMLQIHYFLETADSGSFTNAAKQLYTTQSTLSKTILSKEQVLNVTLSSAVTNVDSDRCRKTPL